MSKTANAIKQLRKALSETINALDAVSEVLEETEPFYFELFRHREQFAESLDQDYVESWEHELDLQQSSKCSPNVVEVELHTVRQAMTDVITKLCPSEISDD